MKIIVNTQTNKVTKFGDNVSPSSDEQLIDKNIDLTAWKGSKIFYNSLRKIFERDYGFQTWTNNTRIEHPADDIIGYNTEANRIEFYIKSADIWLYLSSEFIVITEIPTPPYFLENFETGWFIDNSFISLFIEDLETNWFINNIFNQIFTESFENWN